MADNSKIEWTDATWTPVKGCTRVSPGCGGPGPHGGCYAEIMAARFSKPGQWGEGLALIVEGAGGKKDHRWTGVVRFDANELLKPLHWKRPRRIFVCSTSDLFHEKVEDEWIDQIFAVMALCPQHIFQVLTKRPERMRAYFDDPWLSGRLVLAAMKVQPKAYVDSDISIAANGLPLPNVWLGTSVEDQQRADERIPHLLATPAAVRWLSCEPLLGPVDLTCAWHGENALDSECWGDCNWCRQGPDFPPLHNCHEGRQSEADYWRGRSGIDWVVVGGESGQGSRPMHPDWARSLRDQCVDAGVPFFFKQWGEWREWDDGNGDPEPDEVENDSEEADAIYASAIRPAFVSGAGQVFTRETLPEEVPCRLVERVGKKAAGRLLDGVEHNAMPEFRND